MNHLIRFHIILLNLNWFFFHSIVGISDEKPKPLVASPKQGKSTASIFFLVLFSVLCIAYTIRLHLMVDELINLFYAFFLLLLLNPSDDIIHESFNAIRTS